MTSVPSPTFGPNGFIAPAESAVLAGVKADMNAAFGGNLNPADQTPQGQLAVSQSAIIGDKNDQFLLFTNQVDPAFSSGRMQDAIARIYFLERSPARPTSVSARCSGAVGTVIPVGALGKASDGNVYAATLGGTIGAGGYVDLPFACLVTGPIACPAGSLNVVYRALPGWDSITNTLDGVLGSEVEGRAAFEARRAASVALNSKGSTASIRAAVLNVANVLDAYVYDNAFSAPRVVGGVTLGPNALFVAVSGGDAQTVAEAIWTKKSPGAPYYAGNTSRTVTDTEGYTSPFPTYTVVFETATPLAIGFDVTIAAGPAVPGDAAAQVKAAIIDAFAGGDGGPRASIGSVLFATRFIGPVATLGSWAQVIALTIHSATDPTPANVVYVDIDEVPTISAADITVAFA